MMRIHAHGKGQDKWKVKRAPLQDLLDFMEGNQIVNPKFECHKVERALAMVDNDESVAWKFSNSEECIFVPKPLPKNVKGELEGLGSAVGLTTFDLSTGFHPLGRVFLGNCAKPEFPEPSSAEVVPGKPGLGVVKPLRLKTGEVVALM